MEIEYEYTTTVDELLQSFEEKYGSLEKLRRVAARSPKATQARMDLEEWEHYVSGRGHRHPADEPIHVGEKVIFHDPVKIFEVLTPERVRLLDELRKGKDYQSLRELAAGVHRDPKNVYQDLKALEEIRLVRVDRRNRRRAIPRARVGRVVVTI